MTTLISQANFVANFRFHFSSILIILATSLSFSDGLFLYEYEQFSNFQFEHKMSNLRCFQRKLQY